MIMSVSTEKWLKFFCDAGLPLSVATNYAIIFTNHRIQNDMLADLTKEILYDMGIKTMGDVIAILRHAKSVDHNTTRDQLLGQKTADTNNTKESSLGLRPTLPANSHTSRPLSSRFKTSATPAPTQNSSSAPNMVSLKRSAQTSGLVKSTNPKIQRIIASDDNEDPNYSAVNNGAQQVLSYESPSSSSVKSHSVFSRLGAETKTTEKNSSIFSRLGNTSGLDSVNPKRRVTMSGNSINTTLPNKNIIKLNNNSINSNNRSNHLLVTRTSPKKPISAPNMSQMRSIQSEPVGVKNRIGVQNSISLSTNNRTIVNRSLTSNMSSLRMSSSPAIAQAKRIAMRRAAEGSAKKTISLRKNIFDRLGPISL